MYVYIICTWYHVAHFLSDYCYILYYTNQYNYYVKNYTNTHAVDNTYLIVSMVLYILCMYVYSCTHGAIADTTFGALNFM